MFTSGNRKETQIPILASKLYFTVPVLPGLEGSGMRPGPPAGSSGSPAWSTPGPPPSTTAPSWAAGTGLPPLVI